MAKSLIIKLDVENKIEAWKIVSHLGFEHKIKEATFENKTHKFTKNYQSKDFLATSSMLKEGDTAKYPAKK